MSFPPFRLDLAEERLWKGSKLLAVRRKPFAILRYLVANPRRLVTHDELLKEVWGEVVVSESAVRTHLHELRQVLGEGLIETVIGRGYRFTADIGHDAAPEPVRAAAVVPERTIVGRTAELDVLRGALERARGGNRQLCFVTGMPGIGKTTLVDAFVDGLATSDVVAVRGQSVEQHSTPEAYGPVIEMVGQLRHSRHGEQAIASLVRFAPTFLAQVPHLVPDAQVAEVTRRASGGSEAKMVRELIEALEGLCMNVPLVIVLEDLQWSDVATLDLLALLGQRRERAKLLVIATARHAEANTVTNPLNRVMRTLVTRSGAIALPVDRLDAGDVESLIAARFPAHTFPRAIVDVVESITAGTPLFLTSILDDLVARNMLAQRDGTWELVVPIAEIAAHRPDNVRQLIDIQLDRLTPQEQRVLEAASMVGLVFSTALVAAALDMPVEQVDEICDGLARRGLFILHEGTEDWPEGSVQSCYGVTHGLVSEVCAERSAPARRQRWHRAIAERLEAAYGTRAAEVSTKLAIHYEQGQAIPRAIHFHALAAERMVRRFASTDAVPSYRAALELLKRLPENRERDMTELKILGGMASSTLRSRFDSDPIVRFERMIELARKLDDQQKLCAALVSLSVHYATQARYGDARATNVQIDAVIANATDPQLFAWTDAARALPLFWQGKLADAIAVLGPLTTPEAVTEQDLLIGILDPSARKTVLLSYLGAAYYMAGHPDRGLREIERAHHDAVKSGDPYTYGLSATNIARIRFLRRDPVSQVRDYAQRVLSNTDSEIWHVQAILLVEWANSVEAPLSDRSIETMMTNFRERSTRFPMGVTYVALSVIDALRRSNRLAEARNLADEMVAYSLKTGECLALADLIRESGALVEAEDRALAAKRYREAMAWADECDARSPKLRAALALARLEGGDLAYLATALERMHDGQDLPDAIEAKQLLKR